MRRRFARCGDRPAAASAAPARGRRAGGHACGARRRRRGRGPVRVGGIDAEGYGSVVVNAAGQRFERVHRRAWERTCGGSAVLGGYLRARRGRASGRRISRVRAPGDRARPRAPAAGASGRRRGRNAPQSTSGNGLKLARATKTSPANTRNASSSVPAVWTAGTRPRRRRCAEQVRFAVVGDADSADHCA